MNRVQTCTDMYIHYTAIVQTCIYKTNFIIVHVRYILVYIFFTSCIYQVHTWYVQIQVSMYKEYKSKKFLRSKFEHRTSCIPLRCLNHYASSVIVIVPIVTVYNYCCTLRLVTYVLALDQQLPPRHDVAVPSLNMDLFKAEVGGEAGLGGADVAAHSCPMEEEPAT
jgi:hypothetical protein